MVRKFKTNTPQAQPIFSAEQRAKEYQKIAFGYPEEHVEREKILKQVDELLRKKG